MFDPQGADLAELRLELLSAGKRWGETWLYRWTR
jgi:glucan biosynthesis protein